MKIIKVLNILTGGIKCDGITSIWKTYCDEFKRLNWFDGSLRMDFVAIDEISDDSAINELQKTGVQIINLPYRQRKPIKYFKSLRDNIKFERYDIIHVNGSSSLMLIELLAALNRVKVRIAHSHSTSCNNILLHKILWHPFMWVCNIKLACGRLAGQWLFHKNDYIILNNAKDISKFNYNESIRQRIRKELGLRNDDIAIGHVGHFTDVKNQTFLLDIFHEYRKNNLHSKLYLMGDGQLINDIREKSNKLALQDDVVFTGNINNVEEMLQAMDIMLLPSLYEGFPNVVLEWIAAGLPCLLSDTITRDCALTDLVNFYPLSNAPNLWANEIANLMSKNRDRNNEAINASMQMRNHGFDIKEAAPNLFELYKQFIDKNIHIN